MQFLFPTWFLTALNKLHDKPKLKLQITDFYTMEMLSVLYKNSQYIHCCAFIIHGDTKILLEFLIF